MQSTGLDWTRNYSTAYFDNPTSKPDLCLPHPKLIYLLPKGIADHGDGQVACPTKDQAWQCLGSLTKKYEQTQNNVIQRSGFQSYSLKCPHFNHRYTVPKMLTQMRALLQTTMAEGLLRVPPLAATAEVVGCTAQSVGPAQVRIQQVKAHSLPRLPDGYLRFWVQKGGPFSF